MLVVAERFAQAAQDFGGGALASIVVCSTTAMGIAAPAIAVFGFCISSTGIAIQTIVQLSADPQMRGRVMGLYGVMFHGAPAFGALAGGAASARWGLRMPVIAGAVIMAATCVWTFGNRSAIKAALQTRESASPS